MRIAKKNPLLDENKFPISFYKRFNIPIKAIFINAHLCELSLSKALPQDLKNEITLKRKELSRYFMDLTHYATLTLDPFVITLNQMYWGRDYINCEIENAVFFWLISISPLKEFLPRIIKELSKTYSSRKIVYWLRYADVQTSEITKLLPTSNKNIYRWVVEFRNSELHRLRNEYICIYLKCIHKTMDFYEFKNGRKSLSVYNRNGEILKTFTFQELIDIDNLNGEFKRHIRRTKAEIEAERKKNL